MPASKAPWARDLQGQDLNVRIRAIQFDSDEGALDARDLLHAEDLKQPCVDEGVSSTPREYELEEDPGCRRGSPRADWGAPAPGQAKVEAHHADRGQVRCSTCASRRTPDVPPDLSGGCYALRDQSARSRGMRAAGDPRRPQQGSGPDRSRYR